MLQVRYEEVQLPEVEVPAVVPEPSPSLFPARYERLERTREAAGYDCLIVYADREHAANLAWITGFDPRFEEALWVQGLGRRPTLLVGNECADLARTELKVPAEVVLCQSFSLPDQDRSKSEPLPELLKAAGLAKGLSVGIVGWKSGLEPDIPYWMVQAVQELTGDSAANATGLLMDVDGGIRLQVEPEMVPLFEYGASLTSQSVLRWLRTLEPGITERDSAESFKSYGLELTCHPMVNFGAVIPSGLRSPRNNKAVVGEYAQAGFGVRGSLTARAARLAYPDTPDADDYGHLVQSYLSTVNAWYRALAVGARAGDVFAAADCVRDDSWDFALNPGHLIHLEEWVASPFKRDSDARLPGGVVIQQDIIPVPRRSRATINMEDGVLLADQDLREHLWKMSPGMMERIARRRDFMERLGYELSVDVLPLSNIAGAFFPFLLEPKVIARFA